MLYVRFKVQTPQFSAYLCHQLESVCSFHLPPLRRTASSLAHTLALHTQAVSTLFYICILIACSAKQDKLEYQVLSAKMPSLSRVLFCTLPTALVLALLSAPITPVAALASPLPMPLQADYASRMPSTVYATHKLVKKAHLSVAKHNHTLHGHVAPPRNVSGLARPPNPSKLHSRNRRDNSAEFDALLGQFSNGRDNAVSSSQGLRKYSCVFAKGDNFSTLSFNRATGISVSFRR